jgi:ABC-type transporter Mla MlaB component
MQTQYSIVAEPHPAERAVTLLLNGKFDEEAIHDLESSIRKAQGAEQRVYIDLSEVTLVDRKAVRYLSGQASRSVTLVNCPAYLRRWITEVSDEAKK